MSGRRLSRRPANPPQQHPSRVVRSSPCFSAQEFVLMEEYENNEKNQRNNENTTMMASSHTARRTCIRESDLGNIFLAPTTTTTQKKNPTTRRLRTFRSTPQPPRLHNHKSRRLPEENPLSRARREASSNTRRVQLGQPPKLKNNAVLPPTATTTQKIHGEDTSSNSNSNRTITESAAVVVPTNKTPPSKIIENLDEVYVPAERVDPPTQQDDMSTTSTYFTTPNSFLSRKSIPPPPHNNNNIRGAFPKNKKKKILVGNKITVGQANKFLSGERTRQQLLLSKQNNNHHHQHPSSSQQDTTTSSNQDTEPQPRPCKRKMIPTDEEEEAWVTTTTPRPRRSSASYRRKQPGATAHDAIDLIDDEDEEDDETTTASSSSASPLVTSVYSTTTTTLHKNDHPLTKQAFRIAIGKRVFTAQCDISYQPRTSTCLLSFSTPRTTRHSTTTTDTITLQVEHLQELKFYLPPQQNKDDKLGVDSFFAFKVEQTATNGLETYPNWYDCQSAKQDKRYIVVEFATKDDLRDVLEALEEDVLWKSFLIDSESLSCEEAAKYAVSLVNHNSKTSRKRMDAFLSSEEMKRNDLFLSGKSHDEVLLTYPNGAGDIENNKAAEGLPHASTCLEQAPEELAGPNDDYLNSRSHFLTFKMDDYTRFYQGEWLNDTCVDFWMQWISKYDQGEVHVFSSHFYSRILDEGEERVATWTTKKGIDVFQKKLVFIPINKSLHWSFCVIVNPGSIMEHQTLEEDDMKGGPCPFFLFFDSLRMHNKRVVANRLCKWLNFEWAQLKNSEDAPFSNKSMPIFTPKVPTQDNTWDCGVFVCKYAWAIYRMRNKTFSYDEAEYFVKGKECTDLITQSPEFDFGMDDIVAFRDEMKTLVQNLSHIFWKWEYGMKKKKKAKADKARSEKCGNDENEGGVELTQSTNASSDVLIVEQIKEDDDSATIRNDGSLDRDKQRTATGVSNPFRLPSTRNVAGVSPWAVPSERANQVDHSAEYKKRSSEDTATWYSKESGTTISENEKRNEPISRSPLSDNASSLVQQMEVEQENMENRTALFSKSQDMTESWGEKVRKNFSTPKLAAGSKQHPMDVDAVSTASMDTEGAENETDAMVVEKNPAGDRGNGRRSFCDEYAYI